MAIGRVNTGGGGSGGTLTVTGVAGHTVTATKGGKTYTRTFNSSGVAVFKGLATGTWTLTMTGDGQTATRTVDVNADYAITITYFAATIRITYPATSNCVVKNASGKTVASNSNTGSSTKTWTATVDATGTYTITATSTSDSSKTKSTTVSITADGQSKSVTLAYDFKIFESGKGALVELETYHDTYGTISITADEITIGKTEGVQCEVTVRSEVLDLREYNTLEVIINVSDYLSDYTHKIGVISKTTGTLGGANRFNFISSHTISKKGNQTINIPVSSIDIGHFAMGGFIYGAVSSIRFIP